MGLTGVDKKLVLVIGGARSGKSSFALSLADLAPGPRLYLATATALDGEMEERIRNHKKERGDGWDTMEEPRDVAGKMKGASGYGVILLDCLTLWLTNMIMAGMDDAAVKGEVEGLALACKKTAAGVIAVSNEVGLGIVPDNPLARRFRDLSGLANRIMAKAADEVFFIAAGLPLKMK